MRRTEEFRLSEGAGEAIRRLNEAGFAVVVCTNQRGVARGLMSQSDLDAIHAKMSRDVAEAGGRFDGIYACIHSSEEQCDCRKPRTGMFTRAAAEHDIDVARSFVVGDTVREVEAARTLGCRCVLVGEKDAEVGAWRRVASLVEAVAVILESAEDA